MLAAPEGDGPLARRNRAILALMGVHGLRVAGVAALHAEAIDLRTGKVKVLGRSRKIRTVHLIGHADELLVAWLDVRQTLALDGVSALFLVAGPYRTGTAIGARGIHYLVDKYLRELDLKAEGISCHALRTSSATWARASGARLDAIAGMLGTPA